jgi:hypothetical protein
VKSESSGSMIRCEAQQLAHCHPEPFDLAQDRLRLAESKELCPAHAGHGRARSFDCAQDDRVGKRKKTGVRGLFSMYERFGLRLKNEKS